MSLVYKLKNGSLLDEISGVQGTLTAGTSRGFVQTDKGLAMEFDGAATIISFGSTVHLNPSNSFSLSIWFNLREYDSSFAGLMQLKTSAGDGQNFQFGISSHANYTGVFFGSNDGSLFEGKTNDTFTLNKWYHIILTYNGSGGTTATNFKAYIDNASSGTIVANSGVSGQTTANQVGLVGSSNFNGTIKTPEIYDHVLTTKERGDLYTEFLQAGQTTTAIRGFSFPKDTDLSDEPDLVAAYNMTLVGNQVMDLSPNANHGTNSGAMPTEDGLAFDGVDDRVTSSLTQTAASPFSVCLRFKTSSDVTTEQTLWADYLGASDRSIIQIQSGTIRTVVYDGTEYKVSGTVIANTWYNVVLTWDGSSTIKLYLDAISQSGTTAVNHYASGGATILGGLTATTYNFNGIISDYKAYNRALTAQEAIDYHNSFNRPYIVENFDYGADGVTKLCKNWIAGTGTYANFELTAQDSVLTELDIGKPYRKCVTAGTTALPSNWANGEVSFYLKKGAEANLLWIAVTSNIIDRDSNNGYVLFLNSDESIYFNARTAGINTTLIRSAASYININTWYQIKIQRGSGVFKDIPTLQTSDMVNSGSLPYTSFTSNGRYGFSATSNGSSTQVAGTADEISIVNTEKYLVEFNLKLNSGTLPQYVFKQALPGGTISNTTTAVDGRNYGILTATATDTGVLQFQNSSTATDYTISNLTIRRIYDEGTFLTLIRGGAFGTGWTVVSVVGGSGSNPILDATYLTSNFLVADLDADDCIADAEFFTQFDV